MTTTTPLSGNSPALSTAKTHRLTFDVTSDFLDEVQDVLFSAPRRIEQLGEFLGLLAEMTQSPDHGPGDTRLKAAFSVASDAVRMMALRDGQLFRDLFRLMDDERHISRAA